MFFATLIIAILGKNHNNLCPAIAKISQVLIMKIVNIENLNLYSQTVLGFFFDGIYEQFEKDEM